MTAEIVSIAIAMVSAYLIGSFPGAYIMGRVRKGIDIREVGSSNMGAMNVFYEVGLWEGLLVLVLDIGKGAAAVALARFLGVPFIAELAAGAMVIIGHVFPVFLKFHGGRGGAAAIGILAFLMPWGIPFYIAIFGLGLLVTRFPTLSYSLAFLCFPFVAWFIYHSWILVAFTLGLLLIPGSAYISRMKEMHGKRSNWRHLLFHKSILFPPVIVGFKQFIS